MDRKQKEALVLALAEKGKTYREITKRQGCLQTRSRQF
jgi:hypothetical protein